MALLGPALDLMMFVSLPGDPALDPARDPALTDPYGKVPRDAPRDLLPPGDLLPPTFK